MSRPQPLSPNPGGGPGEPVLCNALLTEWTYSAPVFASVPPPPMSMAFQPFEVLRTAALPGRRWHPLWQQAQAGQSGLEAPGATSGVGGELRMRDSWSQPG